MKDETVAEVVPATTPDITPATPPAPVQPSDDLALRLVEYAEDARQAYAGNTQRAIRSDTRIFGAWCGERGLEALPAAPETIARFVGWQMARGLTVATTRRRMASIAHMHRAAGLPDPTKTNKVRLRMKAMARELGTAQRQARGLGEGEVNQIIGALGASPGFYELRGLSMLLVARDGPGFRSEVQRRVR